MLVIDEAAKTLIDNVVREDDILNENIASRCLHMLHLHGRLRSHRRRTAEETQGKKTTVQEETIQKKTKLTPNPDIERIEDKRAMNPDMDAIYILSPEPHIVDCLMADFERRRYRRSYLVWLALLDPQMRRRMDQNAAAKSQTAHFETLSIDYFPRESHLITFRDPWSFPTLYHPACNSLVVPHMQILAQKVCVCSPGWCGFAGG